MLIKLLFGGWHLSQALRGDTDLPHGEQRELAGKREHGHPGGLREQERYTKMDGQGEGRDGSD